MRLFIGEVMRLYALIVAILGASPSFGASVLALQDVVFQGETYTVDVDPDEATGNNQFWSDYTYSVETPGSSNPSGDYFVERTVTRSNQVPGATTNGPHQTRYDATGVYDVSYSLEATSIIDESRVCRRVGLREICDFEVRELSRDGSGTVDFALGVFPQAFKGLDGYYFGAVGDTFAPPSGDSLFPFLANIPRLRDTTIVGEIDGVAYDLLSPLTLTQAGFQTITVDYTLLSYVNTVEQSCGLALCSVDVRQVLDTPETTTRTYGVYLAPDPAVVPLPASLPLLLAGGGALLTLRRATRRSSEARF